MYNRKKKNKHMILGIAMTNNFGARTATWGLIPALQSALQEQQARTLPSSTGSL